MKGRLLLALLAFAVAITIGCGAARPTPYQPLAKNGGYEESRLQANMYRVSFRGNYVTPETDVLDFVFLRAAELTLEAGYSHFSVLESYGKVNLESMPRSRLSLGFGYLGGGGSSFWGVSGMAPLGGGYPDAYRVDSHLAIFIIYMLHDKPAVEDGSILEALYLVQSLDAKRAKSLLDPE